MAGLRSYFSYAILPAELQLMSEYELLIAIAEDQSETAQKELLTQLTGLVEKAKGEVAQTDSWGNKTLAFSIGKSKNAFYYLLSLKGDESLPKTVFNALKNEDKVLRHLLTKKEVIKKARRKDSRKTKKASVTARQAEPILIVR